MALSVSAVRARYAFGILFALVTVICVLWVLSKSHKHEILMALERWTKWTREHHTCAPLVGVLLITVLLPVGAPSTLLEVLSGFSFPYWTAILVAFGGKTLGSIISFFLGRYVCYNYVQRAVNKVAGKYPHVQVLQELLLSHQFKAAFLFRLAALPMVVKNYAMGAMPFTFLSFFVSTVVTGFIYTLVWVAMGAELENLVEIMESHKKTNWWNVAFLGLGILSPAIVVAVVRIKTRSLSTVPSTKAPQKLLKTLPEESMTEDGAAKESDVKGLEKLSLMRASLGETVIQTDLDH